MENRVRENATRWKQNERIRQTRQRVLQGEVHDDKTRRVVVGYMVVTVIRGRKKKNEAWGLGPI